MLGSQHPVSDLQCLLEQRLRLYEPTLRLVDLTKLSRLVAVLGFAAPNTFSNISFACLYKRSASRYAPCAQKRPARLFRLVAVSGWSAGNTLCRIVSALFKNRSASGYEPFA